MATKKSSKNDKARVWLGVGYLENMKDDWEDTIGDDLQGLPCAYCVHNLDTDKKSEHRKDHGHFIIVFSNTTTYNHALKALRRLDKYEDRTAFNTVQPCLNARGAYDYLIHDTPTARKQGKYQYDKSARVEVNNFDIGAYEQLTKEMKTELYAEMTHFIIDNEILTIDVFIELYDPFQDSQHAEVYMTYMTQLDRLTTAVWKRCTGRDNGRFGGKKLAVTGGGRTTTPPPVTEDGRQDFEDAQVDEVTSLRDEPTSPDAHASTSDDAWKDYFTSEGRPRKVFVVPDERPRPRIVDEHGFGLASRFHYAEQELLEAWEHGEVTLPTLTKQEADELYSKWHPDPNDTMIGMWLESHGYDPKDYVESYRLLAELRAQERLEDEREGKAEDGDGSLGETGSSGDAPSRPRD